MIGMNMPHAGFILRAVWPTAGILPLADAIPKDQYA